MASSRSICGGRSLVFGAIAPEHAFVRAFAQEVDLRFAMRASGYFGNW